MDTPVVSAVQWSGAGLGRTRTVARTPSTCNHPEGHDLALEVNDALLIEARRQCPCCNARLWISVPSVGIILDAVARSGFSSVPDLDVELTRRERQLLNVLHAAPWPLRSDQLAALVWSDAHRRHEVRSTLYRLRVKLRGTPWSIPIQSSRLGLRLVRRPSDAVAA